MAQRDDQQLNSISNNDAIDEDFFIEIVERELKISRRQFKLRLVLLSSAAGKNENFICVVLRAQIKIEILETKSRKSVDVIIKSLESSLETTFKDQGLFQRELFLYKNVLGSFEQIWFEQANERIQFGPECFKSGTKLSEMIVLQDLACEKFQVIDRKIGFNFEQAQVVPRKLAKFHAAGAVLHQQVR